MTHDPLCPTVADPHDDYCDCMCWCDLIARVRDDELHNYHMPAWTSGYLAALDAAREALTEALNALPIKWTSDELFPAVLTIHQIFDSLKEKP